MVLFQTHLEERFTHTHHSPPPQGHKAVVCSAYSQADFKASGT